METERRLGVYPHKLSWAGGYVKSGTMGSLAIRSLVCLFKTGKWYALPRDGRYPSLRDLEHPTSPSRSEREQLFDLEWRGGKRVRGKNIRRIPAYRRKL